MTHGAGRVFHGGIFGICQCNRIRGAWCRLLDINTEKVIEGPSRPCPIAVGFGAGVAVEKCLSVQHPCVRVIDKTAMTDYFSGLEIGVFKLQ